MLLYDTRTRNRVPAAAGRTVRVYVCGITPYDSTHLGHAFTYTSFDAMIRVLEHAGHTVRYARNITDVDDDILRRARQTGEDFLNLAARETERFDGELAAIGLRAPDVVPRPTLAIPAIVSAVAGLLERQAAYALPDARVYFDTAAAAQDHGRFSGLDHDEMLRQFGEKGGDPNAEGKRSALDFLLWQPSADDEPSWPAPWGEGRPGWHIECSAMAMDELGAVIDIHGGGSDLVFPHHEAEILQAEYLTGQRPFARVWAHSGMVALNGEKMSKSRGNLVFVRDLLKRHHAGAIRRYLLSHHYRSDWSFDESELQAAADGYQRWRDVAPNGTPPCPTEAAAFHAALADDLDTPTAIAVLDRCAEAGNRAELVTLAGVLGFSLEGQRP